MRVLVPTEGSEFSKAAIKKCSEIFDQSQNIEIEILSVAEPAYIVAEPNGASLGYMYDLDSAVLKKANDVVEQTETDLRRLLPNLGTRLTSKVVLGSANQEIIAEAENWGADLIVMGSHGYGFWRRALLGSVSESVVHHAPCSVLIVKRSNGDNGNGNN